MQKTANRLSPLAAWTAKQRALLGKRAPLHELVFGLGRWRYFAYRTRLVMVSALLRLSIHIAEFSLVAYALPQAIAHVMLFRLLSLAIEGGWWGMSESMRSRIRLLLPQRDMQPVTYEILGWLTLACLVGGGVFCGYTLAAWAYGGDAAVALLIAAMGFQTAMRLVSRTFYFGAYAIQRVYISIEWLLGGDVAILLLGLALHPWLGEWTIGLCLLASTLFASTLSYRYVRAVTDFLRVTPARFFSLAVLRHIRQHHRFTAVVRPGLAAILMRMHDMAVIATLYALAAHDDAARALLIPVYLVMPLLRASMNWAQTIYFDLTRYYLDAWGDFRAAFERGGLAFSCLLAMGFCAMAWLALVLFTDASMAVLPVLAPYMLVTSLYGFTLMGLFARRDYEAVALLCLLQYATLTLIAASMLHGSPAGLAMLGSLVAPLALGMWRLRRPWLAPGELVEPYLPWLHRLCLRKDACRLVCLAFGKNVPRAKRNKAARMIAFTLAGDAAVCTTPQALYILTGRKQFSAAQWVAMAGGYVMGVATLQAENGKALLQKALEEKLLEMPAGGTAMPKDIVRAFQAEFPTGIVHYPLRKNPKLLALTDSQARHDIVQDARKLGDPNRHPLAQEWFIACLYDAPHISAVLLAPKAATTVAQRKQWQEIVAQRNLRALLAAYGITVTSSANRESLRAVVPSAAARRARRPALF